MSNNMPQRVTSLAMSILLAISGTVYTQDHVARAEDPVYIKNNILQISNPEDGTGKESTYDSSTNKYVGEPWVGNYIYYGNYPQDDVTGNTKDPIKWRVLDNNNAQYVGSGQINQTELETNNGFRFNVGYQLYETETGYGGRQNAPVGGNGVLMMTDKLLDYGLYHPDYDRVAAVNSLCWSTSKDSSSKKGSVLWSWLNNKPSSEVYNNREFKDYNYYTDGESFISKAFTRTEKDGIMDTMVYTEDLLNNRNGATSYSGSPVTTISQDKLFTPSYNEMLNTKYGFAGTISYSNTRALQETEYSTTIRNYSYGFWLRSRGSANYDDAGAACIISISGGVSHYGDGVDSLMNGCVAALNLNQESVIFVSKATESGQSGAEGAKEGAIGAEPKKFELPTGYNNEYKLTIKDANHKDFKVDEAPASLKMITGAKINVPIKYSNAQIGDNEYISAMLTQKVEDDNYAYDETKYYGKIKKLIAGDNGETTITLKDIEPGEYTLKIFNEQCNGDKKTDWASAPQDIDLKVLKVNEFEVSPIAHRIGYEKEVKATLKGENFDIANKLVVEIVDEDELQVLSHEAAINTGETEKTITFSANEISNLSTGHYKIKVIFYDNDNIIGEASCKDVYHVVGEQTISDIERDPSFLQLPFDSATIKVKFKLNGLEEGDTIVSGAAIFVNAAGDEITSSQAIVSNGFQPEECLVNDLKLPRLEAGTYKIKGIMNFNHHGIISQSDEVEKDFEIKSEQEPEPTPTPTPTPTPVTPTPTSVPNPGGGGSGGGGNWNSVDKDDAIATPTPTPTDQIKKIETKTLRDIQKQVPQTLKEIAYVVGYGDGTFKLENNITRAEAAQMIYKLIYNGTRVNYDVLKQFSDVNQTSWYSTAVAYLSEQGLIDGDDGKFYPNRQITRAEMSKILYNALLKYDKDQEKKLVYGTNSFNFTDISNNWSFEPIKQLATNNMIDGYGDGTFKSNQNITRAESVAIIAKVFGRSQTYSQRVSFEDVLQNHWAYKYIMNAVNGEN